VNGERAVGLRIFPDADDEVNLSLAAAIDTETGEFAG
jgi:hypothetical protein